MAEKGFKEPTEIQALTFPAAIMGRRDILGAAETGTALYCKSDCNHSITLCVEIQLVFQSSCGQ